MIWCLPKSVYCYGTSAINIRIEERKGLRKCMEPDSCRGLDHPKFKVNKKIHERQTGLAALGEGYGRP